MISEICKCKSLKKFLRYEFEDEGIKIQVDPTLTTQDYIGIKVDDYYHDTVRTGTPKAVDFIISVDCQCNNYVVYICEFKNVNSPAYLNIRDIQEKFTNTIEDFMKQRYPNFFDNDRYVYKAFFLYLVSDAYHVSKKFNNHEEYLHYLEVRSDVFKKDTLKVERSLQNKLYRIHGKICRIDYDIPPNPTIKRFT